MKGQKSGIAIIGILVICFYLGMRSEAQPPQGSNQASPANSTHQNNKPKPNMPDEGELLFRTHCGRCHAFPEDLSPRESRAVVRQMRVRAMLSAKDEQIILKYLAP